jgi:hypothetical protein
VLNGELLERFQRWKMKAAASAIGFALGMIDSGT